MNLWSSLVVPSISILVWYISVKPALIIFASEGNLPCSILFNPILKALVEIDIISEFERLVVTSGNISFISAGTSVKLTSLNLTNNAFNTSLWRSVLLKSLPAVYLIRQ